VKDDKIAHTLAVNFPCDACGEPVEIGEGNETDGRRLCCECFENQATD
jgi:formylmethanofuran dehydrogenase subunit E